MGVIVNLIILCFIEKLLFKGLVQDFYAKDSIFKED
jgi:hypothetical protein